MGLKCIISVVTCKRNSFSAYVVLRDTNLTALSLSLPLPLPPHFPVCVLVVHISCLGASLYILTLLFLLLSLQKDLVIYEMNVRAFTADKSSGLDPNVRGSYLGVIEKVITFPLN